MRNGRKTRILAGLLAAILLCGCANGSGAGENAEQTEMTQKEASDHRYPVEWARDAVIYEVNVRQ